MRHILTPLTAATLLAACAVTKIDVDVYKGPLANEEDVQLEQMAAIAVGAKPLLIRLRDTLEGRRRVRDGMLDEDFVRRLPAAQFIELYDQCIAQTQDRRDPDWLRRIERARNQVQAEVRAVVPLPLFDEDAKRVNAILCLYEDRDAEAGMRLAARARQAYADYRRAWDDFSAGRSGLWKAVFDDMYPFVQALAVPSPNVPPDIRFADTHPFFGQAACGGNQPADQRAVNRRSDCAELLVALVKAYRDFYAGGDRYFDWNKELLKAHEALRRFDANNMDIDLDLDDQPAPPGDKPGSNYIFSVFGDRAVVRAHARLLFPAGARQRGAFVDRVTHTARSFLDARAALQRWMRISLDRLALHAARYPDPDPTQRRVRGAIINQIVNITGWVQIRLLAYLHDQDLVSVSANLASFLREAAVSAKVMADSAKAADFRRFLDEQLQIRPGQTAAALAEADVLFARTGLSDQLEELSASPSRRAIFAKKFQDDLNQNDLKWNVPRFRIAERRRFGLSRIIERPNGDLYGPNRAEADRDTSEEGATGLERGRLDEGLETLIEAYLDADNLTKTHDGGNAAEQAHRLRDALVRFADKILYVANNDALFDRDDEKKSLVGLLGKRLELRNQISEYVLILQAVGNSIMIQANELQARDSHRQRQERGAEPARAALRRTLGASPQEVFDFYVAALRQQAEERETATAAARARAASDLQAAANVLAPYVQELDGTELDLDATPAPTALTDASDGPLARANVNAGAAVKAVCDELKEGRQQEVISAYLTAFGRSVDRALIRALDGLHVGVPDVDTSCAAIDAVRSKLGRRAVDLHARDLEKAIGGLETDDGASVGRADVIAALVKRIDEIKTRDVGQGLAAVDEERLTQAKAYFGTLVARADSGPPDEVFQRLKTQDIDRDFSIVEEAVTELIIKAEAAAKTARAEKATFDKRKLTYTNTRAAFLAAVDAARDAASTADKIRIGLAELAKVRERVITDTVKGKASTAPEAVFFAMKAALRNQKPAMPQPATTPQPATGTPAEPAGSMPAVPREDVTMEAPAPSDGATDGGARPPGGNNAAQGAQNGEGKPPAKDVVDGIDAVLAALDRMNPPSGSDLPDAGKSVSDENAIEVLDRLIAALQYEHIEAVRRIGEDSPQARQIASAVDRAHGVRAGKAFIRPAASYLRSSYPSASLQNDPGLTWRNELARQAVKSMPILGGSITRKYLDASDVSAKVRSQIDRQFWQNVNSIRVSGAGNTNYVMVQDDIGNWYVKGYSANPERIFQSAAGLAQFALGNSLGTDILNRPPAGQGGAPAPQPTALEAVFDKQQDAYDKATAMTFADVRAAVDGELENAVTERWNADSRTQLARDDGLAAQIEGAEAVLDTALEELNKDDADDREQVAARPARIVQGMKAMDRFRTALNGNIRKHVTTDGEKAGLKTEEATMEDRKAATATQQATVTALETKCPESLPKEERESGECAALPDEKTKLNTLRGQEAEQQKKVDEATKKVADKQAAIDAAVGDVNQVVEARLNGLLERREATVKAYENAIAFTGEVVSAEGAPPPAPAETPPPTTGPLSTNGGNGET